MKAKVSEHPGNGPDGDGAAMRAAMSRELVWIEQKHLAGWGCSECAWFFNPTGTPAGKSFDEMMGIFELKRNQEFASHTCADHPRTTSTKNKST